MAPRSVLGNARWKRGDQLWGFLVYLEILCLLESQGLLSLEGSLFFLKYNAVLLRTFSVATYRFLPCHFRNGISLSLFSLCGKGNLGGWPVLAGEKQEHVYLGLWPQHFQKEKHSHLSILPQSIVHLWDLQRCLFQGEHLCHCGLLSSRTIRIIFLQLNIRQHFWWRASRKAPTKLNLGPAVVNSVYQLSDLKTVPPRFIQGPWKGH